MKNKFPGPYGIVGYGKSGIAAYNFLLSLGTRPNSIFIFDDTNLNTVGAIEVYSNPEFFLSKGKMKTLIVSPGYPLSQPWIRKARDQGIQIINEITLASQVLTTERLIGITGSVGKSTVVALLEAGLPSFSSSFFVGGNYGTPFCVYANQLVSGARPSADWVVLELSSYHLETLKDIPFEFSAITYLTPNHLERYNSVDDYYKTKWRLLELTEKKMILNQHGGDLMSFAHTYPPSFKGSNKIEFASPEDPDLLEFRLNQSSLLGTHNQDNLALAGKIILNCKWPLKSVEEIKRFPGLPHRLENLGCFRSITFINDSKATTIESVKIAVQSLSGACQKNGVCLHILVGGKDKNLPWEKLGSLNNAFLKFYFFGQCGSVAKAKSGLYGSVFTNLQSAFDSIKEVAQKGDYVLLSPGGTSLDEFSSFEERGQCFKNLVLKFAQE